MGRVEAERGGHGRDQSSIGGWSITAAHHKC